MGDSAPASARNVKVEYAVNVSTIVLGSAYATLVAAVGLWLADYVRPFAWARAAVRVLGWAAAALVAGYLLAAALVERRPLFLTLSDFLAAASAGMVALASVAGRGKASPVGALVLALAALTPVLAARPDASPAVDQHTPLYTLQAALHALGVGACVAALLGASGARSIREEHRLADDLGIALMGIGFVLTSAWAWLNWGVVWRSDPRLNLMASGWLCVFVGRLLRAGGKWESAMRVLGVALMLIGAFGGDWLATGWPGLSFVAW